MGPHHQTMQMKATLCVFVALVAVTSAAPTFMANRRGACVDQRFCTSTCSCGTTSGDTCNQAVKYCTTNTVSTPTVCSNTDGTTAVTGACQCGTSTVTAPATQFVDAAQGAYCLYSKNTATGGSNTQASSGSCPKVAGTDSQLQNAATTCTTFDALNGCAAGKVCFNGGGKDSCALATCSNLDGTTAVTGDCACGANGAFAATGKFCNVVSTIGFVSATKKCSNTDGSAAVDAACTCGTATAVAVANAKYCVVTTAGVGSAHEPPCTGSEADGSTAATNACSCGTTGTGTTRVATAAGKFCQVVSGAGYVSATKKCSNEDGTTAVNAACTCGTTTQAAVANTKFCQVVSGAGYASNTKKCSNTDGSAAVDAACTCGTATAVQVANAKYCVVTTAGVGSAHEPPCTGSEADGSTAATNACSCGTTGTGTTRVATAAGKFCQVVSGAGYVSTTEKCSNTDGTATVDA